MKKIGIRGYFINTLWLVSRPVSRLIAAAAVGIFVIRYLGPEQFGMLSYAESFVTIFLPLVSLGLDQVLVRNIVRDRDATGSLLGTSFLLQLAGALVSFTLIVPLIFVPSVDALTRYMTIIIAVSIVFRPLGVLDIYFQSQVTSQWVAIPELIGVLISTLAKAACIIFKAPLVCFALIIPIESLIIAFGLIVFYCKKKLSFAIWKVDWTLARRLLSDSYPLMFSGFAMIIFMRVDQLMIREMMDSAAVGQYAAAVRLSEVWYFIPGTLCASVFPALVSVRDLDRGLYYHRLQNLYAMMFWLALSVAVPLTFLSGPLVEILFGQEFTQSASVLRIHIWGGIFVFMGHAGAKWLIAENMMMKNLHRTLAGLIINILLNLFLIPRTGINGAAVATLAAQAVAGFLYDAFDRETRMSFLMKCRIFTPFWQVK
ncbi:MAG: flippase [Deltaproteobacteria bacterium]|nr:flippase [Deltaproteobacteria bacterium]